MIIWVNQLILNPKKPPANFFSVTHTSFRLMEIIFTESIDVSIMTFDQNHSFSNMDCHISKSKFPLGC